MNIGLKIGEFYGINPPEANLELVSRFFEKYPSYTDKAFLSVKVYCNFYSFVWSDEAKHELREHSLTAPARTHRKFSDGGGVNFQLCGILNISIYSSPENLKRSVDNILSKLRGMKKLDLFQVGSNGYIV